MTGLVPFNRKRGDVFNTNFDDFYNVLDDFFTDVSPMRRSLALDTFKVDVIENEEAYEIVAEMPGIKKEEVNLSLDEGKLTIEVNHEEVNNDESKKYLHREIKRCSMKRSIYLKDIDASNVVAKLEEGVLKLDVPKLRQVETKHTIEIQ